MSTEAQIKANQANAQLSTGPKSDTGKAASCMNNFRFGFTGAFTVLASEDQDEFDRLLHGLSVEHQPKTITERILVEKMAQHHWLSKRAQRLQDLAMGDPALTRSEQERQFALFLRYQTTNDRAFSRALNDLLKLRAERRKQEIGFESQKQREAQEARRQATEKRKQELHKHAVDLAEAKVAYQEALTFEIETEKIIAEAQQNRLRQAQRAA